MQSETTKKPVVQDFDLTAEYASEKAVLKALTLADGWAYALAEVEEGSLVITALTADLVYGPSPVLLRTRESLATYIWNSFCT